MLFTFKFILLESQNHLKPIWVFYLFFISLKAKLFKKRVTWPGHWPISDELLRLQIQNNSSRGNLFDDVTR